jgi:hypothetical protein
MTTTMSGRISVYVSQYIKVISSGKITLSVVDGRQTFAIRTHREPHVCMNIHTARSFFPRFSFSPSARNGVGIRDRTRADAAVAIINIAPSDLRRPLLSLIRGSSMKFKSYNYARQFRCVASCRSFDFSQRSRALCPGIILRFFYFPRTASHTHANRLQNSAGRRGKTFGNHDSCPDFIITRRIRNKDSKKYH